jgi:hypothetical protein
MPDLRLGGLRDQGPREYELRDLKVDVRRRRQDAGGSS